MKNNVGLFRAVTVLVGMALILAGFLTLAQAVQASPKATLLTLTSVLANSLGWFLAREAVR